jgi:hypothetical protein
VPQTDPYTLALALSGTLPEESDPRSELIALGMVTSGVICEAHPDERAGLVERFVAILRGSITADMH